VIPAFEPSAYPGPRPDGPVLVHAGTVVDVEVTGRPEAPVRPRRGLGSGRAVRPPLGAPPVLTDPTAVRWSVAYGSNASPGRLVAKGLDRDGAVLLPATLPGWVPAFEHRHTGYGSVPLTLVPQPGAQTRTWVLGLPPGATRLLDRTEGRDASGVPRQVAPDDGDGRFAPRGTYQLAVVGEVVVAGAFRLSDALAYVPGHATRVQVLDDGRWRTWPEHDQHAAREHVGSDRPAAPAPLPARPVLGPWPRTPLRTIR
jgi:hypothetical protein